MDQRIYLQALRSAAQLTVVTGASGLTIALATACGGAVQGPVQESASDPSAEQIESESEDTVTAAEQDLRRRRKKDAGVADSGARDSGRKDAGHSTLQCKKMLKDAFPNGDPDWFSGAAGQKDQALTYYSDADLVACCKNLVPAAGNTAEWTWTHEYRNLGCCELAREVSACTPWGPACPRGMQDFGAIS
jgi:hypothetical protein